MATHAVLPPGMYADSLLSMGLSSLVFLDKSDTGVVKIPRRPADREAIQVEKQIYERLSHDCQHHGLLAYQGSTSFADGKAWALHLERATNGQLSKFLPSLDPENLTRRIQWAIQIADALDYVHINDVVHGDVSCNNVFLDEQLNAKLGDFAGSSIDGSELLVACAISHEPPWSATPKQADIFAFGSVCYKIMTGFDPVIDDQTVVYPDLKGVKVLGDIIEQCWKGRYASMNAVRKDLALEVQKRDTFYKTQQLLLVIKSLPLIPLLVTVIVFALPLLSLKRTTRLGIWW